MTEQEIIKLLQDCGKGKKPLGDHLNPDLKKAIEAVYLYGYNQGYDSSRAQIKLLEDTQDSMIQRAKDDQRRADKREFEDALDDMSEQHDQDQREIKQLKADRDRAAELLHEAISLLS